MLANEFHGCRMEQVPYPKISIRGIIANDTKQPETPTRVPAVRMRGLEGVALERRLEVLVSTRPFPRPTAGCRMYFDRPSIAFSLSGQLVDCRLFDLWQ